MAVERKMRGRIYVEIDVGELAADDVVDYRLSGHRVGRVTAVSPSHVTVAAITYQGVLVRGAKRVHRRNVLRGWRRRQAKAS